MIFCCADGTVSQLAKLTELNVHAVSLGDRVLEGAGLHTLELHGSCDSTWHEWPRLGHMPCLSRLAMYHMPSWNRVPGWPILASLSTLIIHMGCASTYTS